jgi:hypothetical protein
MPQGTLNQVEPETYVHYDWSEVVCKVCAGASEPFVTKDHLTADESLAYIEEMTGFKVRKDGIVSEGSFVCTGINSNKGGLACPTCYKDVEV